GFPFIEAARLLARAYTGEILITEACWSHLRDSAIKAVFTRSGVVAGKRRETYPARCWQVVDRAECDRGEIPARRSLPGVLVATPLPDLSSSAAPPPPPQAPPPSPSA